MWEPQGSCKDVGSTPNQNSQKGSFVSVNDVDFFDGSFESFKSFESLSLFCLSSLLGRNDCISTNKTTFPELPIDV